MSTFRLYFRALFGTFFVKFSQNKIVMGQKILVPCFDVYNDRPFPKKYTVKDYIFNTKLFCISLVSLTFLYSAQIQLENVLLSRMLASKIAYSARNLAAGGRIYLVLLNEERNKCELLIPGSVC